MPVTCAVFPDRSRAELMVSDPYTFTEFEEAMRVILDMPALPQAFEFSIDRRSAARPTSSFVTCVVNFFRAHEAHFAGTRAAALVSRSVPDFSLSCASADSAFGLSTRRPTLNSGCVRRLIVRQCPLALNDTWMCSCAIAASRH